jgi:hypothetical protein
MPQFEAKRSLAKRKHHASQSGKPEQTGTLATVAGLNTAQNKDNEYACG